MRGQDVERLRRWRDRAATQVLPAVAVTVAALVFLGPGKQRPIVAVRVFGIPETGSSMALRLQSVRRFQSVDDAVTLAEVRTQASSEGRPAGTWQGALGSDGVAEIIVEPQVTPSPARSLDLEVVHGEVVLASGSFPLRRGETTFATLGVVQGQASGELDVRVDALRGHFAAPFSDGLRVTVHASNGPPATGIEVETTATGAKVAPERVSLAEEASSAIVQAAPLAHDVELTVSVRDARGRSGRWEGKLPVTPGAMWIEPRLGPYDRTSPGALTIASPSPRERAYLSVLSEQGRVFGAVVPLAQAPDGFFKGQVTPPALGAHRIVYAIVSSDPQERGVGTIAWPLAPPEGAMPIRRVELLIDGLPAAEARERARLRRARNAGVAVIVTAALAQILLMMAQNRAAQRGLEEHFKRATLASTERLRRAEAGEANDAESPGPEPEPEPEQALLASARGGLGLRLVTFIALIALAFAMVAALAAFRL